MGLYVHQGIGDILLFPGLKFFPDKQSPHNSHLKLGLLNLMPLKQMTETDFIRLLGDCPLDVDIEFLTMASHPSKNTPQSHIDQNYLTTLEAVDRHYDGIIITGAPVEKISFEEVDYWDELTEFIDRLRRLHIPTLYICWAAFAGLYHNYGIAKFILERKISGVYEHLIHNQSHPLFSGIEGGFYIPHSRYASFNRENIASHPALTILSESDDSGIYIVEANGGLEFYITGHSEYAPDTLDFEYHRDLAKGINPHVPMNYYPDDNPDNPPIDLWSVNARKLFANWVKFYLRR